MTTTTTRTVPVKFGTISASDKGGRIAIKIKRDDLSVDEAEALFCGKRIIGRLMFDDAQKRLPGLEEEQPTLPGQFDSATVSMSPKMFGTALKLPISEETVARLYKFVGREGRLQIDELQDLGLQAGGTATADPEHPDQIDGATRRVAKGSPKPRKVGKGAKAADAPAPAPAATVPKISGGTKFDRDELEAASAAAAAGGPGRAAQDVQGPAGAFDGAATSETSGNADDAPQTAQAAAPAAAGNAFDGEVAAKPEPTGEQPGAPVEPEFDPLLDVTIGSLSVPGEKAGQHDTIPSGMRKALDEAGVLTIRRLRDRLAAGDKIPKIGPTGRQKLAALLEQWLTGSKPANVDRVRVQGQALYHGCAECGHLEPIVAGAEYPVCVKCGVGSRLFETGYFDEPNADSAGDVVVGCEELSFEVPKSASKALADLIFVVSVARCSDGTYRSGFEVNWQDGGGMAAQYPNVLRPAVTRGEGIRVAFRDMLDWLAVGDDVIPALKEREHAMVRSYGVLRLNVEPAEPEPAPVV